MDAEVEQMQLFACPGLTQASYVVLKAIRCSSDSQTGWTVQSMLRLCLSSMLLVL